MGNSEKSNAQILCVLIEFVFDIHAVRKERENTALI